jgi:hypothetical protein
MNRGHTAKYRMSDLRNDDLFPGTPDDRIGIPEELRTKCSCRKEITRSGRFPFTGDLDDLRLFSVACCILLTGILLLDEKT